MREINTQEGVLLATNIIIILFSFCLPFTFTSPSTLLSRAQGDAIPLTLNFRPSIGSRRHTEKQFDHVRTQSLYKYTYPPVFFLFKHMIYNIDNKITTIKNKNYKG